MVTGLVVEVVAVVGAAVVTGFVAGTVVTGLVVGTTFVVAAVIADVL